ncbi:hypothetical protein ONE63_004990 [Megalurothrips usitatus]|uniref:Gustatory receptor n=1 Tax=Megalurothrips usitatus TaxID=439358 RepID=A0AAV7X6Y3_9NEOP|nr:hypothetical protein ONE63_004990 [Megalurothrips usitatus]
MKTEADVGQVPRPARWRRRWPAEPEIGEASVQRAALQSLSPVLYTARMFGLAAFRLLAPSALREAAVAPSPVWAAYSAVAALAALVAIGALVAVMVSANESHTREDGAVELPYAVLAGTFALKQTAAVLSTVVAIVKGVDTAAALEKLVRVASRAGVGSCQGAASPAATRIRARIRAVRRASLVQTALLLGAWPALVLAVTALGRTAAAWDVVSFPPLFLVNVLFTDVALLLHAELEALNDSLEARFQPKGPGVCGGRQDGGRGGALKVSLQQTRVSCLEVKAKSRAADSASATPHVLAARDLQRELRRTFQQLDEVFGLQTLLFLSVAFVQTTVMLYMMFVEGVLNPVASIDFVVILVQLYATLAVCQNVKDESRRTAVVVHRCLLSPDLDLHAGTRAALVGFSVQLLSSEMAFSACGFFDLDLALLQSFVGTVVTYIVIMVQFRGPSSRTSAEKRAAARTAMRAGAGT